MKQIAFFIPLTLLTGCISPVATTNSNANVNQSNVNTDVATATETWQLQGTGHSYNEATKVVDDGSTLPYAFYDGDTTKFYYNPTPNGAYGNGIRPASNGSSETTVEALSHFDSLGTGLKVVCDQMNIGNCSDQYAYYMTASQAIPLQNQKTVRLFFEAKDLSQPSQGRPPATEIFSIDSQDGYVGEDFNRGTDTLCGGAHSSDYAPTGDCALALVVAADENSGLAEARQFKIGYPTLADWRWDEAVGTFMVITGEDRCDQTKDGLFYAVFDGTTWPVTKDDAGCAQPLVPHAHGPVLVNTGAGTYKLYYEDIMSDAMVDQVTKPLRYITADATRTGDPAIVDFADWDSYTAASEVNFVWPDGTALTADEESGLGDHFIFVPDGLDSRVMYLNLGGFDNQDQKEMSHGLGMAVPVTEQIYYNK